MISRYSRGLTLELPKFGEVKRDNQGNCYCHICGFAFKKVLSHATQKHKITALEYKKKFGLYTSKGLLSTESKKIAQNRTQENYSLVVEQNLIKGGDNTRYKKGSKGRTKDKVSEQQKQALKKHKTF